MSRDILKNCNKTSVAIGLRKVDMFLPDIEKIKQDYKEGHDEDSKTGFPFWAKLWPSARALSIYLERHHELLLGKRVFEIGAGLGLPSLIAAKYAADVICSDIFPEALEICIKNAEINQLNNVAVQQYDWSETISLETDIIIASDISYDPDQFENLVSQINHWLNAGKSIILSTPQRLQAVPFVQAIENNIIDREDFEIMENGREVSVTVFGLGNRQQA